MLFHLERIARSTLETPRTFHPNRVILASFPKTGSTYTRFLVSNIYKESVNLEKEVNYHTLDYYSPVIRGNTALSNTANPVQHIVFLKTHFAHVKGFDKFKSIVIWREPVATLNSYKKYLEGEHGHAFKSNVHFLKSWRYGVSAYCNFYNSWFDRYTYLLQYDKLVQNTKTELTNLYNAIDLNLSERVIEVAIKQSSRENMNAIRQQQGDPYQKNPNYRFVSTDSQKRNLAFSKDEVSYIKNYTNKHLKLKRKLD